MPKIADDQTTSKPTPADAVLFFLNQKDPSGLWVLTAILPDGPTITRTFKRNQPRATRAFIDENEGERNLYYSLAQPKNSATSKLRKDELAWTEFLHVDIDPRDDETPKEAKTKALAKLKAYPRPPTAIIDSGNGLQALWLLDERIMLDPVSIADIEARNVALAKAFGADTATFNVDRIFRLPGTTNLPNAKKRRLGRVKCRSRLIEFDERKKYSLKEFPKAVAADSAKAKVKPGDSEPVNVDALPIPAAMKNLIREGDVAKKYKSRSHALWAVLLAMVRARCTDPQMTAVMLTQKIGEHVHEQPDVERYVKRQIARARERVQTNTETSKSSEVIRASDVVIRPLQWIWKGHLLRGAQEINTGITGLGKSQVQCSMVASVTTNNRWPDGTGSGPPRNVVMLTAEDGLDQIVVPRLMAAGADLTRVHFLKRIKTDEKERQFLLAADLDELERVLTAIGDVALITIDPITAYMGRIDSHSTTDVRGQLGPLADFADRMDVAISTITHPPKGSSAKAIDLFIGSQAFIATARIGHVCVEEMQDDEADEDGLTRRVKTGRVLFTMAAHNPSVRMPALAYRIEEASISSSRTSGAILAPRVVWDGTPLDIDADEALAAQRQGPSKRDEAQEAVQAFLRTILMNGKMLQSEIEAAAARQGFTLKQLRTARERLGIIPAKAGFQGPSYWQLP